MPGAITKGLLARNAIQFHFENVKICIRIFDKTTHLQKKEENRICWKFLES